MEQGKNKVVRSRGMHFFKRALEMNGSIKRYLDPAYRRQYNIRRFFSCFFAHFVVLLMVSIVVTGRLGDAQAASTITHTLALIYSVIAWKFWHFAYWSFQGGIVDRVSNSIIHFGTFWKIIGKIFLKRFLLLTWIGLIAPLSGIKTWRKAKKRNKTLYINKSKW